MDSIVYNGFSNKSDTFRYEILEFIDTAYLDLEGEMSYMVAHYYRLNSNSPWTFYVNSILKRNKYTAEQLIYDQRKMKLNFPIKEFKSWDENAFNTDDYNLVRIRNLGLDKTYNSISYSNTFEVDLGEDIDDFIQIYGLEVYAKGIGLIRKEYINTETQNGKTKGSAYTKTLLSTNWK